MLGKLFSSKNINIYGTLIFRGITETQSRPKYLGYFDCSLSLSKIDLLPVVPEWLRQLIV